MMFEEFKAIRKLGFRFVSLREVDRTDLQFDFYDNLQVLLQVLNFASVIASGLMIWKGLGVVTNTESPIVVVLR